MNAYEGSRDVGQKYNKKFNKVFKVLNIHQYIKNLAVYAKIIYNHLLVINLYTNNLIIAIAHDPIRTKVILYL